MKYITKIRDLREDHDLTQTQVAKILGISVNTYARYERGEHGMSARYLVALCDLYKVSSDYILGRTEKQ